jgi:type II secretory pathway component PulF
VVAVMMIKVVPGLLDIFPSKDDLPASTLLLISISDTFVAYWIHMISIFVLLYIGLMFWKKTDL